MDKDKMVLKKSATAMDVARQAGVSQSTVSRVFNKNWKGPLGERTRQKVLKVADEIGYTPNALAHVLISKRSNIIGVVVSKEYDVFYSEVLYILTDLLAQEGLQTMVFTCSPTQDINDLLRHILQYQVDGVVITSAAMSHRLNSKWLEIDAPVVLYNGYLPGMSINAVHSDNFGACVKMADFLVGLGHQKFAYFTTEQSVYHNYMPRQDAFLFGLSQNGISDCQIAASSYHYEQSLKAAREYFARQDVADAIFCAGDLNAIAAVDAAREFGYEPGKDISIAGFYAPVSVGLGAYELTCLKQDVVQLARDAILVLMKKIAQPGLLPQVITRPMKLCVGKTTRRCPELLAKRLGIELPEQNG